MVMMRKRADPLPVWCRYPPGTPEETIAQAEQSTRSRWQAGQAWRPAQAVQVSTSTPALQVSDNPEFQVPELPEWLQWAMVGLVVLVALVVIFGRRYISRITGKSPVVQSPAPSSWVSYATRPEQFGLIDTSPEARAVQGDRYWQPGTFGFQP